MHWMNLRCFELGSKIQLLLRLPRMQYNDLNERCLAGQFEHYQLTIDCYCIVVIFLFIYAKIN